MCKKDKDVFNNITNVFTEALTLGEKGNLIRFAVVATGRMLASRDVTSSPPKGISLWL